MIKRIIVFVGLLALSIILVSCSGGSTPTAPTGDENSRVLGILTPVKGASVIAFTRALKDDSNPYGVNKEIFIMGPNGGQQTRLTNNPADDDWAAFSPKGFSLAFCSNRQDGVYGSHEVYRMDSPWKIVQLTHDSWEMDASGTEWVAGMIAASQLNTLIKAPFDVVPVVSLDPLGKWQKYFETGQIANYGPSISKDGKQLCFAARPAGATYFDNLELYLQDLTGGLPAVQYTHFGTEPPKDWDNLVFTTNPSFDPTGTKIVFQTNLWDKNNEIAWIDLLSMAPTVIPYRLTQNKADDVEPCWDPTGNWIAFSSNRDGNYEIYKMWVGDPAKAPAQTLVRLTKTPEDESNPDWGPILAPGK